MYHHIGIYAFTKEALLRYVSLDRTKKELDRNLEQLRAIENNMKIHIGYTPSSPLSVDTEEDLRNVQELMKRMKKNKVAFQGELGAYSHIAINELFENPEIKTCATFEETFKVAFENDDYKIVIPLENSLAGRVADIHYLLPKYKLQIHAEHFQKVEHNLLAKENAKLEDIKYVRSHSQAIGQCQKIIMENKYKTIISADTAGSAKELSDGKDNSIAAIASKLSAKIYKLKI